MPSLPPEDGADGRAVQLGKPQRETDQLVIAGRHAVEPDLLPKADAVVRLMGKSDLYRQLARPPALSLRRGRERQVSAVLAGNPPDQPGVGDRLPPGGKPVDQLPVRPGMRRARCGEVKDRLQEVGLALPVRL